LPVSIDCPNRSPRPSSAWAVAVRVWLSLIGSTCLVTSTTVSKRVLNSVVTVDASIGVEPLTRSGLGSAGEENAMYLLPNTVLAWMSASTLAGIMFRNCLLTSSRTLALGSPPTSTASTSVTRPISTPL